MEGSGGSVSSYGHLTNEDIAEILRLRMNGYSPNAIADRLNLYPGIVFKLFRRVKDRPEAVPEPRADAVENLERVLDRLAGPCEGG
jgi:hypothetical protein